MSENIKSGYKCSLNYTPKNSQGEIKIYVEKLYLPIHHLVKISPQM